MSRAVEIILWLTLYAMLALAAWTTPGRAHSWYDATCCSERDCRPMASDEFAIVDGRLFILATGQSWALNDVRESKDAQWHVCIHLEGNEAGRVIERTPACVYMPPSF